MRPIPATLLLASLSLGAALPARAQAVGQADVQIQSLSVTRILTVAPAIARPSRAGATMVGRSVVQPTKPTPNALAIQVGVFSNNDDDAQNVKLAIFLPPETFVVSAPAGCTATPQSNPASGITTAYVLCLVGAMPVNASRSVALTVTMPPSYVVPRVGVFAWADTPDPNTANNHAEQVAP